MDFWLKDLAGDGTPAELPEVTLTRARDGKTFKGPGSVTRRTDGQLTLKLYSPADFNDGLGLINGPPGTVIPKSELFDLQVIDMHGHSWRSDGIWPDANVSMATGLAVVEGKVDRLVGTRSPARVTNSHLTLAFRSAAKFPANQREQIERRIGDKLQSATYSHSAAELETDGLRVQVHREGELLVVAVAGEWLPADEEELALHIVGALQFMLGCRLQADAMTLLSCERQMQVVQSVVRERTRSTIQPPRHWRSAPTESIAWDVFKSFLRYARGAPRSEAKEACRWVSEVIDTGTAPLEVSSLVLSVAVEGVVGLMQGSLCRDESLQDDIQKAVEVARHADFPARLKPRILGAIQSMAQPRARDYLEALVKQGTVPAGHLDAWKALRHAAAHAEAPEGDWVVPTIEKSAIVLALYYRLVFLLIGYQGPYTDYSERGWPERTL